jgi:D-alanine--poly(phosphoribitol) ligase subunit 1
MLTRLLDVFQQFGERKSLFIKGRYYTYRQFSGMITAIADVIKTSTHKQDGLIGIVVSDEPETYASFFAAWLAGFGFVPIHPKNPCDRNNHIIEQSEISLVLVGSSDVSKVFDHSRVKCISTLHLISANPLPHVPYIAPDKVMCILFTSGSTGVPKGVPMTYENINTTLDSFWNLGYRLDENDRFLQMFEFTFDMSMLSYLPAFLLGACVYSVADAKVRYLAAIEAMQTHQITFAAMVPSTLAFLKPYFKELKLDHLKYSLLGGEPFYVSLAAEWAKCIPNAIIDNISGPTETTMACMGYTLQRDMALNKTFKGVLAFGKPWKNTKAIVVDENLKQVPTGIQGELCFAGDHVMKGYWKMEEKNSGIFFDEKIGLETYRFYRTGDMAFVDEDGDYLTCGRLDEQVKIQGHRVELAEIEVIVREYTGATNVSAMASKDSKGFTEIVLFIEASDAISEDIMKYLRTQVPSYMIPSEVIMKDIFPRNINGKIDKVALFNSIGIH